jgi:hypothetical protein
MLLGEQYKLQGWQHKLLGLQHKKYRGLGKNSHPVEDKSLPDLRQTKAAICKFACRWRPMEKKLLYVLDYLFFSLI